MIFAGSRILITLSFLNVSKLSQDLNERLGILRMIRFALLLQLVVMVSISLVQNHHICNHVSFKVDHACLCMRVIYKK